jgi:hypothetical protein
VHWIGREAWSARDRNEWFIQRPTATESPGVLRGSGALARPPARPRRLCRRLLIRRCHTRHLDFADFAIPDNALEGALEHLLNTNNHRAHSVLLELLGSLDPSTFSNFLGLPIAEMILRLTRTHLLGHMRGELHCKNLNATRNLSGVADNGCCPCAPFPHAEQSYPGVISFRFPCLCFLFTNLPSFVIVLRLLRPPRFERTELFFFR